MQIKALLALAAAVISVHHVQCISLHGLASPWRGTGSIDLQSEFVHNSASVPNLRSSRDRDHGRHPVALLANAAASVSAAATSALDFEKVFFDQVQICCLSALSEVGIPTVSQAVPSRRLLCEYYAYFNYSFGRRQNPNAGG
jgi:hypothetical protein